MTKVEFDLTRDDLIAFNLYHHAKSPAIQRQRRAVSIVLLLGGLLIGGILVAASTTSRPPPPLLWVASGTLLIMPLFLPRSYRRATMRIVSRMLDEGQNRGMLGRKEITITPTDLCAAGELRSLTVRWKAVERVVEVEDWLYLYISSIEAILVPRRAFANDAEFAAFAQAVRAHQQAAQAS